MRDNPSLFRTIDANLNRFKEGIRVVEDILRYEYDSPLAKKLKEIRHINIPDYETIISYRNAQNDILKPSTKSEQKRTSIRDIVISNLKRAQESARVLEEIYKLYNIKLSEDFKAKRYELYTIEKEVLELIKNK
jgi:thiamine-phosphate pyrophosphorylase